MYSFWIFDWRPVRSWILRILNGILLLRRRTQRKQKQANGMMKIADATFRFVCFCWCQRYTLFHLLFFPASCMPTNSAVYGPCFNLKKKAMWIHCFDISLLVEAMLRHTFYTLSSALFIWAYREWWHLFSISIIVWLFGFWNYAVDGGSYIFFSFHFSLPRSLSGWFGYVICINTNKWEIKNT